MKIRNVIIFLLAVTVALFTAPTQSLAERSGDKKGHSYHSKSMKDKFFKMAHHILLSSEELKLTDEQADKIKDLKIKTKKDLIMKEARIEVIKIDIKSLLWEHDIDLGAVNKLIEQKYDIKKAKAKIVAKALAELKNALTAEQKEMLEGMYKAKYKGSQKGSMKKSSKGSMK